MTELGKFYPSGILVLKKPKGESSRATLNRLQYAVKIHYKRQLELLRQEVNRQIAPDSAEILRALQQRKPPRVGHAGTLDPLATGVLVACVGEATKLTEALQTLPKKYTATFRLGAVSDTEDVEGNIRELDDPPQPTLLELQQASAKFVGNILQHPPIFSALKVGGQRSYNLARQGLEPELQPRKIVIDKIEVLEYQYPFFRLFVECGSGTYLRSLGRDMGESLGSGAIMTALTREQIGEFRLENAALPTVFDDSNEEKWLEYLLPTEVGAAHLPRVRLTERLVQKIRNGQLVRLEELTFPDFSWTSQNHHCEPFLIAAFSPEQKLVSLLELDEKSNVKIKKNFVAL
jgi:tRNA pseudouridine55 synthase